MNPLLLPDVAVQGAWVRRRVDVLPEASGPTTGTTPGAGGPPIRLAVLGESPFEAFPSLPRLLSRYLAERARLLDDITRGLCTKRPDVSWIGTTDLVPAEPEFFARDGFHPSSAGYHCWARTIDERLVPDTSKLMRAQ
jgi:lysophospholipase L1-like esterase